MNKRFQPFEYQLNLNSGGEKSPGKIKKENVQKTISVLITPETNVYLVAKKLCFENNLRENLVPILATSISDEIEKQVAEAEERMNTYESISSNFSQESRAKSFKNRFCSSLQDSQCSSIHNQSTFRNTEFVVDPSTVNNSDEDEYSFRPATYLKLLDMTDGDDGDESISVNEFSVNQSYLAADSRKSKEIGKFSVKNENVDNGKNVFDNLYHNSKALQRKKDFERKKSIEKITFIPQINPMSKKILENKKETNIEVLREKSINRQNSRNQSPSFLSKSNSKSSLYASRASNIYSTKKQNEKENEIPIYERGMIYRKVSQEKLIKMKEKEIIDEIKSCTFKPKLNPRDKSQKSKILPVTSKKLI